MGVSGNTTLPGAAAQLGNTAQLGDTTLPGAAAQLGNTAQLGDTTLPGAAAQLGHTTTLPGVAGAAQFGVERSEGVMRE